MTDELKVLDQRAKDFYYNDDFQNALLTYAEVFTKYPAVALAYNNYGNILRELGLPALSYGFLETAIRLEPDSRIYGFNLAVSHLAANNLATGWELFEHRWRFKNHENTLTGRDKPRWEGQDLRGKRLLITCEEGDGDNIQFSRFTQHLSNLGAHVIHQTEPGLYRLFTNSFPNATVITNKDTPPEYDYWTPILSIPKALNLQSYDDMPYVFGYIKPNKDSINIGKKILGTSNKPKVGFCWGGRTKSFPFNKMVELVKANPQFQWVNFQVLCSDEERLILDELDVIDLKPFVNDWEDTAGIMNNIDMMISIDTGLCHIAGGLGIPCVLLLDKFKTCWRWLLNRDDTVWYPSVRIFKQTEYKNYDEQLLRVHNYLQLLKQ
jgi:hypothetical protein